jgi:hypothetical protein
MTNSTNTPGDSHFFIYLFLRYWVGGLNIGLGNCKAEKALYHLDQAFFFFFFFLGWGVIQGLAVWPRLPSNSCSSCLIWDYKAGAGLR